MLWACRRSLTFKGERRCGPWSSISFPRGLYYVAAGNFKVVIAPSELQKKALGKDTYWPFQMQGFPVGFDYPANAAILGQSGARKNPLKNTISYAIIKACLMGDLKEDGSRSFLRFEKKDWGKLISFFPTFLLLTSVGRYQCVEL
jgi:hypothetical protein